ncbi:MAG: hypothetical protein U1A77_18720 [Pirellulales bacterium]
MISTLDLTRLPNVARLREVLRSMAMLDAILCPDWDGRYYSFDARWAKGEEMGSMRNGSGDELFALFNDYGCFLKGFVHDSPLAAASPPAASFYAGLPQQLSACATEAAFSTDDVTFCLWRSDADARWNHHAIELPNDDDADGSAYLLSPLDGNPETYWLWAEEYYETDVALHAVKAIYERQRLTDELVRTLNPDLNLKQLKEDLRTIGYPT